MSNIKLIHGDCMDVMREYPDKYFDLADADPPYFSGPEKRKYYGRTVNKLNIKRVDYPVTDTWELPNAEWFNEVKRVSKNWIIWGANYFDFIETPFKTPRKTHLNKFIEDHPTGWIVWDKCNDTSSFNDFELAYTSFDIPTTVYKFMWNGMMQGKSMLQGEIQQGDKKLNQKRIHPTEKPIFLYDWIYNGFTNKGFTVLNTHGGSYACAISALKFDFKEYVCCEKNYVHHSNGKRRYDEVCSQISIFDVIREVS